MKKRYSIRGLLLGAAVLFSVLGLSGCSRHYTRDEAVQWFQEEVADVRLAVSGEYEERENDQGYTDYVWTAWLRDLPEVRFELVSHEGYSLFSYHGMQTDYYLRIGEYYVRQYEAEGGDLSLLETGESSDWLELSGEYEDLSGLNQMARQMEGYQNFVERQEYPCSTGYSLWYSEPVTSWEGGGSDTGVFERDNPAKVKGEALESLILYTVYTGLEPEMFTEEQKETVLDSHPEQRFTLTREDGAQVSYPGLALHTYGGLAFGGFYSVLTLEGWEPEGSTEAFTFTDRNGRVCSFSYEYRELRALDENGDTVNRQYYYLADGEKVYLSGSGYCITSEELQELTGLTYERNRE